MLKDLLKIVRNFQEDEFALNSLKSALTIAEAQALPPFLPRFVINGISELSNSSFDSGAETNPTGIPTRRAGFAIPSLII